VFSSFLLLYFVDNSSKKTCRTLIGSAFVESSERRISHTPRAQSTQVYCVFRVAYYRFMFMTRDYYDNRFIMDDFRQLDMQRARIGRETVLPLTLREMRKYIIVRNKINLSRIKTQNNYCPRARNASLTKLLRKIRGLSSVGIGNHHCKPVK